jgi:hypothetical protein
MPSIRLRSAWPIMNSSPPGASALAAWANTSRRSALPTWRYEITTRAKASGSGAYDVTSAHTHSTSTPAVAVSFRARSMATSE